MKNKPCRNVSLAEVGQSLDGGDQLGFPPENRRLAHLSPPAADQQGVCQRREVGVEGVGGDPREEGEDQAEQLVGEGGDGHPQIAEDQR